MMGRNAVFNIICINLRSKVIVYLNFKIGVDSKCQNKFYTWVFIFIEAFHNINPFVVLSNIYVQKLIQTNIV